MRHSRKKVSKWYIRMIALGLMLIILIVFFAWQYRPLMIDSASKAAQNLANEIMNVAVLELLTESGVSYDSFISIVYNETGEVKAMQANAVNINRLKSDTALRVQQAFKAKGYLDVDIPLGTLCGWTVFGGIGPLIPCRSLMSSIPRVVLQYHFDGAGINQTLHSIIMTITVPLSVTLPLQSAQTEVKASFLVGETILVGQVPDSYTNVISDPEVADDIFNYGDIG